MKIFVCDVYLSKSLNEYLVFLVGGRHVNIHAKEGVLLYGKISRTYYLFSYLEQTLLCQYDKKLSLDHINHEAIGYKLGS